MSLPVAENAPESGASRPILIGPPWASAAAGAASTDRRATKMRGPVWRGRTSGAEAPRRRVPKPTYRMTDLPSALASTQPADQAARGEEDGADIDGSQDQEPALRVDAHEVLEEDDDRGADRRADERPRAAQRHHQERLHRGHELHVDGAHEAVVVGPEHAREAGERAGEHEGQVLVEPDVVPERPHPGLALADALEPEPEGRAHEEPEEGPRDHRRDEGEVEERQRPPEAPRQPEVGPRHARDPVIALGQRYPAEGEPPDHHAQGERDHQE